MLIVAELDSSGVTGPLLPAVLGYLNDLELSISNSVLGMSLWPVNTIYHTTIHALTLDCNNSMIDSGIISSIITIWIPFLLLVETFFVMDLDICWV